MHGFEWYLRGRHGRKFAKQFRKSIDAVLVSGSYEQIRISLETWLNRYLDSVREDLQELTHP